MELGDVAGQEMQQTRRGTEVFDAAIATYKFHAIRRNTQRPGHPVRRL